MTGRPVRTIAVLGAGAAGAAAAGHLARLGYRVTILEAKAFPRAKVCGEYISPAATAALEAALPAPTLLAAGARRVDRFTILLDGRTHTWRTPAPAWALSRRSLDTLLLDAARDAGTQVLQPMAVRSVDYAEDGVAVRLADGHTLHADLVVHADGSGRHDPAGPIAMAPGMVGAKCHLRGADLPAGVGMRAAAGAYVGTIAVEEGLGTVALAARAALVRAHGGDFDALLAACWPSYRAGWREGDWMSCGVARSRYREPGHPRSVRVGNAAAAVDPVGGEGIGLALWSAERFATLLGADADERRLASAKTAFARSYRARLRTRRWACRLGAEAFLRPGLVRACWPVLAGPGGGLGVVRAWYRLSGKPAAG